MHAFEICKCRSHIFELFYSLEGFVSRRCVVVSCVLYAKRECVRMLSLLSLTSKTAPPCWRRIQLLRYTRRQNPEDYS